MQICQSVLYMHSLNIVHRDIKLEVPRPTPLPLPWLSPCFPLVLTCCRSSVRPQNVLFNTDKEANLIDFGFSVVCPKDKRLKVFCGTPSYMAPEIVKRTQYKGKPTDIWSLGVVLYAMLCGSFPFSAKSYPDLYKKIIRGFYRTPDSFSPGVKDLLSCLLVTDPNRRYTVQQALEHPWVRAHVHRGIKHRQSDHHTVSQNAADDLYKDAIARMESFGVSRDVLISDVTNKRRNALTTCYYLLLAAMQVRTRPSQNRRVTS